MMTTPTLHRLIAGALLSLGCSARTVYGPSSPTDDTSMTGDAAIDVSVTPDVSITPDVTVTPDVSITPDVIASPDVMVTPDATRPPDVTVVMGCYVEDSTSSVCPAARVMNSSTQPSFRITHLGITSPTALASPILNNTVNGAVHAGGLLWGLSFDLGAMTFRTGPLTASPRGSLGQGLLDGTYQYSSTRMGALMSSGDRVTTTTAMGTVAVPIYDGTGAVLTTLPLDNVSFTATMTPDRGCVGVGRLTGGRFNECTSVWDASAGQINAVITVANARMVTVSALMTTLCNLIAGSNCETTPQAMWTRQHDTTFNGMPAYALSAGFAAVAATVR